MRVVHRDAVAAVEAGAGARVRELAEQRGVRALVVHPAAEHHEGQEDECGGDGRALPQPGAQRPRALCGACTERSEALDRECGILYDIGMQ